MTLIKSFREELDQEAVTSRKMLSRIPADNLDWRPHRKNWTIRELAMHIAEIPGWIDSVLNTTQLDFATVNYQPPVVNTPNEIMVCYENTLNQAKNALNDEAEFKLNDLWTLRTADKIHMSASKKDMVRHCINQQIHHRAQLGMYLRLLDVPIPGSYGPSADEQAL